MIRTRDFLLLLISVGFLLVIIASETAQKIFTTKVTDVPVQETPVFDENQLADISVEVTPQTEMDRNANIERLREQLKYIIANPPEPETVLLAPPEANAPEETSTTSEAEIPTVPNSALQCGGYRSYSGNWPNELLTISEQEGVRVIADTNQTADGEQVIAVLPIRTLGSAAAPSCLPNDVVAVAQSGGLIRNGEPQGYSAFPEHVLIGYTLDGFSLYGYSERVTDICGGVTVDGEYRYYLSKNRQTILNCFAAPPVALPS